MSAPTATRFCIHCRYCDHGKNSTPPPGYPDTSPPLHFRCKRGQLDLVSGRFYAHLGGCDIACHDARSHGPCGGDGKFFEPITPDAINATGKIAADAITKADAMAEAMANAMPHFTSILSTNSYHSAMLGDHTINCTAEEWEGGGKWHCEVRNPTLGLVATHRYTGHDRHKMLVEAAKMAGLIQ